MTKRFTIAMVALALFVLMAVMPVAAIENGTIINQSATVFIGEQGLNVTHALNMGQGVGVSEYDRTPGNTTIGWWASAAQIWTTSPTKVIDLGVNARYKDMTVAPADFVGYTGNWYVLAANGTTPATTTPLAFVVADPTLDIKVWDLNQASDVSGKSVPQGTPIGFRIDTNLYPAVDGRYRSNLLSYAPVNATQTVTVAGFKAAAASTNIGIDSTGVWSNGSTVAYTGNVSYTNVSWTGYKTTWGNYTTYTTRTFWYHPAEVAVTLPQSGNFTSASTIGTICGINVTEQASTTAVTLDPYQYYPNTHTDGYIDIKVKDESGTTFTKLFRNSSLDTKSLTKNFVNNQPFFWGTYTAVTNIYDAWATDAIDFNNQYAYPVGTYTVSAESKLNKMKDNYKNAGADYTGKTVSQSYTITLVSDTVKIEANKDSVVRSKSFSVTVTGKPSTTYYVWVKGTGTMTGTYDDQPPMVALNQEKVYIETDGTSTYPIGQYQYENGANKTIINDTARSPYAGTRYYCMINTSTSGTRTVEFVTNNWTKAQKYTIRVEQNFPVYLNGGWGAPLSSGTVKSDEVDIKVEKGAVTIVAAGDQSYYLGEEIKFSGTNTETYKTYLFIIGPNLHSVGSNIKNMDPRRTNTDAKVINGNANTFKVVDVNGDNTWSWKWGTSNYALDAGTYTIYAVSQPYDKENLEHAAYGTVSIIIKKPFVSATASQSTVAKGDRIYITGTAEGEPTGVYIWILGKNYAVKASEAVNSDASFKYEVRQETTKLLYAGQYFVVVQHPMQNDQFDIDVCQGSGAAGTKNNVCNLKLNQQGTSTPTQIFTLLGSGSLQGSDAAEALVEGINDPNVDDTYTKLQFLIEEPVIRIDPIGDKRVGDKFTITAQTNLAVDDEILVQVYSSSFKPTQKSQSGEFSGATGTVKVTKGDSGMNKISFDVDSSTFKPDEYIVTESAVIQDVTGTALFNVLEGSAPTAAPTAVVTAAPTAAPTQAPTQAPTAAPTPVPTTKSPGYGALIALIGLGAVAFIVVRRH